MLSADTKPKVVLASVQENGQSSVIASNAVWEVISGQLLHIKCEAAGTPLPTVEWLRPGIISTRKVKFTPLTPLKKEKNFETDIRAIFSSDYRHG